MITRKCPCCGEKTIKPLKIYHWNICSQCKSEITCWNFGLELLILALILRYFFDLPNNVFLIMLFFSVFDGIIASLFLPLSVLEKTENNDLDLTKKV